MRERLRCRAWTLSPGCWTGRGPRAPSCSRSCWARPGRCGSPTRRPWRSSPVLDGAAWIVPPEVDGPVHLAPGDTAVARGPDHYTVADRPDRAPTLFIGPGGDCRDADGQPPRRSHAARRPDLGQRPPGSTALLDRHLPDGRRGRRAGCCAPCRPLLVLHRAELGPARCRAARRRDRAGRAGPGGGPGPAARPAAHHRAARAGSPAPTRTPPAWYAANADPRRRPRAPAPAPQPGAPLDRRLARRRRPASPARRSPAASPSSSASPRWQFLTGWRLALAADLLRDPRRDDGGGRPPGRLQQPFRAQHGVQAGPRSEPAGAPRQLGRIGSRRRSRAGPPVDRAAHDVAHSDPGVEDPLLG